MLHQSHLTILLKKDSSDTLKILNQPCSSEGHKISLIVYFSFYSSGKLYTDTILFITAYSIIALFNDYV